ncbi:type III-B CRISPR module RAMP protein Cmr4 [Pyrobaculum sp.]|uniref:type III-B CRISPR module RAMP protein Cmr4 n=1 Tax=Pyrobaculum sp. TaxID=2004705 RepID=UPI003D13C1CC
MALLLPLAVVAGTALHVGMGRSESHPVDLPVQRDEFDLPAIWASSLKGAFRASASGWGGSVVRCIFGAEPGDADVSEASSAVAFMDARLFIIPARTFKGVWIYITSPAVLRNVLEVPGFANSQIFKEVNTIYQNARNPEKIIVSHDRYLHNGRVDINGSMHDAVVDASVASAFGSVAKALGLPEVGLAVVPDDYAVDLINKSLLVQYRVRLSRERKSVEEGPWSEEYVPQYTVFISAVKVERPRGCDMGEGDVAQRLKGLTSMWMGGKETIGKGLVRVVWIS